MPIPSQVSASILQKSVNLTCHADADKQVAINLFLGMKAVGVPLTVRPSNRSYVQWYTPSYIEQTPNAEVAERNACEQVQEDEAYWVD